jgi:hypothetical protein
MNWKQKMKLRKIHKEVDKMEYNPNSKWRNEIGKETI